MSLARRAEALLKPMCMWQNWSRQIYGEVRVV